MQLDSLVKDSLRQELTYRGEGSIAQTLHLIIYDTSKPADTLTGKQPVLLMLDKETHATRKDTVSYSSKQGTELKTVSNKADSTHVDKQRTVSVAGDKQSDVQSDSQTKDTVETVKPAFWPWLIGAVSLLLLVAMVLLYIRFRK